MKVNFGFGIDIDMQHEHVGHTFFVEQLIFFCQADDIFEKSVEHLRFKQMKMMKMIKSSNNGIFGIFKLSI